MMKSNKKTLIHKRALLIALLCASLAPLGLLAQDQNSSSSSSSSSGQNSSSSTSGQSGSTSGSGSSIGSGSTTGSGSTLGASSTTQGLGNQQMTPQHFAWEAAVGGLMEVRLGQLAVQKAQNPQVRDFGQRMVTDHSQANQRLTQIAQSEGINLPSTNLFMAANRAWGAEAGSTSASTTHDQDVLRDQSTPGKQGDIASQPRQGAGSEALNRATSEAGRSTSIASTSDQMHSGHNWGDRSQLIQKDERMYQHLQALSGSEFDRSYIQHMLRDHQEDIQKFQQASQQLTDAQLKQFATETLPKLQEHYRMAQQIATELGIDVNQQSGQGSSGAGTSGQSSTSGSSSSNSSDNSSSSQPDKSDNK